jgi:hypothetical protein
LNMLTFIWGRSELPSVSFLWRVLANHESCGDMEEAVKLALCWDAPVTLLEKEPEDQEIVLIFTEQTRHGNCLAFCPSKDN